MLFVYFYLNHKLKDSIKLKGPTLQLQLTVHIIIFVFGVFRVISARLKRKKHYSASIYFCIFFISPLSLSRYYIHFKIGWWKMTHLKYKNFKNVNKNEEKERNRNNEIRIFFSSNIEIQCIRGFQTISLYKCSNKNRILESIQLSLDAPFFYTYIFALLFLLLSSFLLVNCLPTHPPTSFHRF